MTKTEKKIKRRQVRKAKAKLKKIEWRKRGRAETSPTG